MLLELKDVSKRFNLQGHTLHALRGVSFPVERGQVVCLVGESGSGKSTLARCVAGLCAPDAGRILLDGVDIAPRRVRRAMRATLCRRIQLIVQDSLSAMSPALPLYETIAEPLRIQQGLSKPQRREAALRLMAEVGLARELCGVRPHALSGGQRQRACIARALAPQPELLLADEPVASLDASIQAQVLQLLLEQVRLRKLALLLISHDLNMVRAVADEVVVLRQGQVVERASVQALYANPLHPYTRALLAALPSLDPDWPDPAPQPLPPAADGPFIEAAPGHFVRLPPNARASCKRACPDPACMPDGWKQL